MAPMRAGIEALRVRTREDRAVVLVHSNLPSNDFTSLFTTLDDEPGSYLSGQSNVFPSAIGRSYFDPILPPSRVALGWSSNALHWLSRNPTDVADHGGAIFSASDTAWEDVEHQLAGDGRHFPLDRPTEWRA